MAGQAQSGSWDKAPRRRRQALKAKSFRDFWSRMQPGRRKALIVAAGYLHEAGYDLFCRSELAHLLSFLGADDRPPLTQRSLIHLARCGYVERRKRGVYAVTDEGLGVFRALKRKAGRRDRKPERRAPRRVEVPNLEGISSFLRAAPSATVWLKTLLCAYFLQRYCGVERFNRALITACFKRVRGARVPGSLPALLSKVLSKERGLIEACEGRGFYRLTDKALRELSDKAYVKEAEQRLRGLRELAGRETLAPAQRGEAA